MTGKGMSPEDIDFIVADLRRSMSCIAGNNKIMEHISAPRFRSRIRNNIKIMSCIGGTIQEMLAKKKRIERYNSIINLSYNEDRTKE